MFPETKSTRETSVLEGKYNKPVSRGGPDIKCSVIFLDFHFNSDDRNRRSESKQSIRFL